MKKGTKVKNYCICETKKGILYRDIDCDAKYIHNGKKTVIIHNFEALKFPFRYGLRLGFKGDTYDY